MLDEHTDDGTNGSKPWLPELHLMAAWVLSLVAFVGCSHFWLLASVADCSVMAIAHMACLPLISRSMRLVLLPALGCVIIGLAIGFQVIDLCFDILIIWDRSIHDGQGLIPARKIAWLYYNTMLNSRHVNFALAIFLLVGQFGALVGVTRSPPRIRWKWINLVCTMFAGNGSYLVTVVPRYIGVRASRAFEEGFFDGWSSVMAARMLLFLCLAAAVALLCSLLVESQQHGKLHAS